MANPVNIGNRNLVRIRMDNLTHSLAGAALAGAGLRRVSPLATATLVVAANAPDIDAFIYLFRNEYFALAFRRGWTHGPLALALLPFAVTGAVLAWDGWVRRGRDPRVPPPRPLPVLLLALFGVLTHPALDWMNTYGIRLLAPFSMDWFYGDALFIVDPWLWLALGASVFFARAPGGRALAGWVVLAAAATTLILAMPFVNLAAKAAWVLGLCVVALVRRAAGGGARAAADRTGGRALSAARWALGLAVAYIGAMVGSDVAAVQRVREAARERGIGPVTSVMVAPVPADPFRGMVVVETPTAYHLGAFDWLGAPRVRIGEDSVAKGASGPVVEAASATEDARNYLIWSRFPVFHVDTLPDGYRVRIGDARYLDMADAGGLGGLVVRLDRDLRPLPDS